ncbi:hypothetical protein CIJ84_00395 [Neisseria meningitidis]|uniref:Uncharacterized protein n=1 Tax=Neisseria meningitidis TaxID=487 RepID=A0AB37KGH8_NEIME|nr:hypothetical protein [Neisseria meningitidis]RGA50539.1 hypothetical protein CIJ82_01685 [Neisseria meningitidis]RGA59180.1 hypothetical protein CIJ77_00210 [Neisseria meningitidis]RGA61108.1 hypothetical protein CIJ75_01790 [Neisseria meningitidis]RGA71088.1 hypothetical protein CIJ72_00210 [Neisseria meningitidis]
MGLGIQTDRITDRRIKKCRLKHVCLQTAFFQDKAANDVSIQSSKQWFERQKRVYTARILVGFNLHIGFKVGAVLD